MIGIWGSRSIGGRPISARLKFSIPWRSHISRPAWRNGAGNSGDSDIWEPQLDVTRRSEPKHLSLTVLFGNCDFGAIFKPVRVLLLEFAERGLIFLQRPSSRRLFWPSRDAFEAACSLGDHFPSCPGLRKLDDIRRQLLAAYDLAQPLRPCVERRALFRGKVMLLIDANDPGSAAGHMI